MRCTLCYAEFDETQARESCAACLVTGGCQMIKCPNCGMEIPEESKWAKKLIKWFSFKKEKAAHHVPHRRS